MEPMEIDLNITAMLDRVFDRTGSGRYYIEVEALGPLTGMDAARCFAETFRRQHPHLDVEQRNTRVYVGVPEMAL